MSLTRVDVDYAGSCDSTGAVNIPLQALASQYGVLNVNGETTGSARWAVLVRGRAVTFGRGPRVDLGPIPTQPGDQVTVSVLGAVANATVTGKMHGIGASSLQEALERYVPSPNTIAVDTASPMTVIGTIQTVGNADTVSKTFPVPSGTLGIAYIVRSQAGDAFPNQVQIKGDVTNDIYVLVTAAGGAAISFASVPGKWLVPDVNAVCSVTSQTGPGAPAFVEFVALSYVGVTTISKQPGSASFDVTMSSALPALWQAPANQAYAEGTANGFTIVAGVANTRIYVFGVTLAMDSTSGFGAIKDGSIGTSAGRLATLPNGGASQVVGVNLGGIPISTGASLIGETDGTHNVRVAVSYSQG